ncbi:MAG: hypothetical protein C0395_03540 [Gemmatimonas sp.]|nr:hypothetical protein [Gemmatimonas sp.]
MRRFTTVSLVFAVAFCTFHAAVPAQAGSTPWHWTQDFSSLLGRNAANTTADWDTAAGRLELPRLELATASTLDTPGSAAAVVQLEQLAFVADSAAGLHIVVLSHPAWPELVGTFDSPGTAMDVALHPPYALLADGATGYQAVLIEDLANPVGAGTLPAGGFTYSIDVQGDVAVLAVGTLGVQFVDVTDPENPVQLAVYNTPGTAFNAVFAGRWVFVADGSAGLRVIDAADPSAPVLAGLYDTPGTCYDVLASGGRVYLADYGYGVHVLDASAPAAPSLLGSFDTPGQARGLALDGRYLHVADSGAGVLVLDVSDPASIRQVQAADTPGLASGVCVMSEHTLVADATAGLKVMRHRSFDVEPAVTTNIGSQFINLNDILTDGLIAYLPTYLGINVYNLEDPAAPLQIGFTAVGGLALDRQGTLLVAAAEAELSTIDVADPGAPVLLGMTVLEGWSEDVAVSGRYAYVCAGNAGMMVADLVDPAAPVVVATLALPGSSHAIAVVGDRAYVAAQHGGLIVVDVSDPLHPASLGSFPGGGNVIDVAVSGFTACISEPYNNIVRVLNVSDPAAIVENYALAMSMPRQVVLHDGLLAASAQDGLWLCNLSSPGNAALLPMEGARAIAFSGDDLLVQPVESGPVALIRYAERYLDPARNVGQGMFSWTGAGTIMEARLTTEQAGAIDWYADADNGTGLQPIPSDGTWTVLNGTGQIPVWRAVLGHDFSPTGPYCDSLTLEVLRDVPVIDTVADVPDDQGGQVRLRWARSSFDRAGSNAPILNYSVYRRVDARTASSVTPDPQAAADRSWPPGEWDYLATVPADLEDLYTVVVPTLHDATVAAPRPTTFFVRARTEELGVVFDAPPDSGSSVDNLAPAAPGVFTVAYTAGGNLLAWGAPAGDDIVGYRLYRGTFPGFAPAPDNLLGETALTAWIDHAADPWTWSYLVAAVDRAGNEGPPTAPDALTGAPEGGTPAAYALRGAAPNPFNPSTTLSYEVPAGGGDVRLDLLDARGRIVRTLVAERRAEGRHEAAWNGRDDAGRRLPSGVYFARLRAAGCREVIKVTLAG